MDQMAITVYTTQYCSFCRAAKKFLETKGLAYEEVPLDDNPELRAEVSKRNGNYRTVPMIEIDGKFVGGYSELVSYF